MSPHAALRNLLLDLLTPDALKRFICDATPAVRHEIAWSGPPIAVADSVADTLRRHGYLDVAFFTALRDELPRRAAEIEAVAGQFGVRLQAVIAPAHPAPPLPVGGPAPTPASATAPVPVFISYSHADAAWVERLALNLHNAGLEVLIDSWLLAPGDNWVEKLSEGLDRCQCALIVISEASVASPWVQSEMTALLAQAVSQKKRVIGVRHGNAPIPSMLANYQWVDFRQGDPDGSRFRALVDALEGRRPGPPPRTREFHTL